jgi:hypothetical protein
LRFAFARFAFPVGAGAAALEVALPGTEFIARFIPAVTTFVAEAADGIFAVEFAIDSWIVSIGVLMVFSIADFVSGPPIMNMTDEMIKIKANPKTIQGV